MEQHLPAIEVETRDNPQYAVIWLHGLGADGSDFVPVVPELGLADAPGVRFIFPHAPEMPVTCNGGYVMRAWYDIVSLDSSSREIDEAGIVRSRETVRHLIARENRRGIPCARIARLRNTIKCRYGFASKYRSSHAHATGRACFGAYRLIHCIAHGLRSTGAPT